MPTIVEQPRWSFWKFREVYQCELSGDVARVREAAASFFRRTAVKDFSFEPDGFRFRRSSGWRGWISISERKLRHEVSVEIHQNGARVRVTIAYRARYPVPLPNMHFRPSDFLKEVGELEAWLNQKGNREFPPQDRARAKSHRRHSPVNFALWMLYRSYRLITWSTYWTKRRFTTVGQAVFGAVCVAVVTAFDMDGAVGYQAVVPLMAVLFIAFVFSFRFRVAFEVERKLPRVATAGLPFTYRVTLKNLTRKPQAGLTLIEDLADPRPTFQQWKEFKLDEDKHVRPFRFERRNFRSPFKMATVKEAEIPSLKPQQRGELTIELTPVRRGVVRLDGLTIARPDPLGLYRALRKQPLPQSVLILPKRYPLPPIALPGGMKYQQGGVAMASHIGQSEEFVSLREYRRGDPPRHIHWRSWAKAGKPIVKEYEDEFFVRHALVLDTFTARPHSEVFEEAVSVAASFACTVLTQESLLDLLFVGPEAYCFTAGRGLAHADQMLEILASVSPCGGQPFAALETLVVNHANTVSGCICIMLAWDDARKKFVEKLKALDLPVVVVVIRPAGETEPLEPGPMSDAPERLHALEIGRIEEQLARLK